MTRPVGRPGGGVAAEAGRAIDLSLHCTACDDSIDLPGPWRQNAINAWSNSHRAVVMTGWTVADGAGGHTRLTIPTPPQVHDTR